MDQQQIKTLIDLMAASDLSELTFSQDGWTLRLGRDGAPSQPARPSTAFAPVSPVPPVSSALREVAPVVVASHQPGSPSQTPADLVAPLYGVLHLSPSPGQPVFAQVGDTVRAGQTLCVIEAMKVFNEVCATHDGVLQAILARTGEEVEGGQPLFRFA